MPLAQRIVPVFTLPADSRTTDDPEHRSYVVCLVGRETRIETVTLPPKASTRRSVVWALRLKLPWGIRPGAVTASELSTALIGELMPLPLGADGWR